MDEGHSSNKLDFRESKMGEDAKARSTVRRGRVQENNIDGVE
jgi:hypothetical protein